MRRLLERVRSGGVSRPEGDLGPAPDTWRGFIPRTLPHTSQRLRIVIGMLASLYAGTVLALAVFPTPNATPLKLGHRPPANERVLVHTEGSEHTRDIMRWIFLGLRPKLAPCLARGQAIQFDASFEDGRVNIDAVRYRCVSKGVADVRVPRTLTGRHRVTLTKVWLSPPAPFRKTDVDGH